MAPSFCLPHQLLFGGLPLGSFQTGFSFHNLPPSEEENELRAILRAKKLFLFVFEWPKKSVKKAVFFWLFWKMKTRKPQIWIEKKENPTISVFFPQWHFLFEIENHRRHRRRLRWSFTWSPSLPAPRFPDIHRKSSFHIQKNRQSPIWPSFLRSIASGQK